MGNAEFIPSSVSLIVVAMTMMRTFLSIMLTMCVCTYIYIYIHIYVCIHNKFQGFGFGALVRLVVFGYGFFRRDFGPGVRMFERRPHVRS